MSDTVHALDEFRRCFLALEAAAAEVRRAIESEGARVAPPAGVPADVAIIMRHVAHVVFVREGDITGPRRTAAIVQARHVAMSLCRELTVHSVETLGAAFGGRDHGTILHAQRNVANWSATDPAFATRYARLRETVRAALSQS